MPCEALKRATNQTCSDSTLYHLVYAEAIIMFLGALAASISSACQVLWETRRDCAPDPWGCAEASLCHAHWRIVTFLMSQGRMSALRAFECWHMKDREAFQSGDSVVLGLVLSCSFTCLESFCSIFLCQVQGGVSTCLQGRAWNIMKKLV